MNVKQQELLDRLKKAIDNISKSPKTAAEVMSLLEDFVTSLEEISEDLATMPDEQVARNLREIARRMQQ